MSATKGEDQIRSADQIENDLKRKREVLEQTVNELAGRLDPKNLAQDAQDQVKEKASEAADKAKDFFDEVKNGNLLNIAILSGAVLGSLGLLRRKLRHRK